MTDPSPIARRTIAIAFVVALAQFMQMLDAAVISIALPPMARDFAVSPVAVGFGITVYVLAASIVIPTAAWLADRPRRAHAVRGRAGGDSRRVRRCVGLSQSLWQFVAARALQGIAGALMAPVAQIILLRSVERSELLRVMNISSAPMLVAPVDRAAAGRTADDLGGLAVDILYQPACERAGDHFRAALAAQSQGRAAAVRHWRLRAERGGAGAPCFGG